MDKKELLDILKQIQTENLSPEEAMAKIEDLPYKDLGHTKLDTMREIRVGYPEVIYSAGKTIAQFRDIFIHLKDKENNILATRATEEQFAEARSILPQAEYNSLAKTIIVKKKPLEYREGLIAIVTAGTSDSSVAEEAAVTLDLFGNKVNKISDVGVAGIHRLFSSLDVIRKARVLIVVAGMEGALASVIGGLVDKPVIAVPTSVGYGAHFNGLAPLLAMLNSCASGVGVVNIDNGFGAAYLASAINRL